MSNDYNDFTETYKRAIDAFSGSPKEAKEKAKLEQLRLDASEHQRRVYELERQRQVRNLINERLRQEAQRRALEQKRLEELQILKNEKRKSLFDELRLHFEFDFLSADSYFQGLSTEEISKAEYEQEKVAFVKAWFAENTSIEKHKLPDDEQAAAIAAVNGHIQVVARAGSGKTSTLVNRTLFLLKHCGVAPSQMLLLAFNRKAVLEIRRRLLGLLNDGAEAAVALEVVRREQEFAKKKRRVKDDIEASAVDVIAEKLNVTLPYVMTFHALALSVAPPEGDILSNSTDGLMQGLSRVFQNVIDDHLQLPEFHRHIRELMLAHFREDWDRIANSGYDLSKDDLLKFRRSLPRESLGGDNVKSYGEKVIADFLFEHDVAYKYERNHSWSGINYRPDFTIFTNDKRGYESGVIIEYFGLAGDPVYDEMTAAKRKYWSEKKNWNLVEFIPSDVVSNGVDAFQLELQTRLEKLDVPCVRLSEDEIWHRLRGRAIDRFTKAMVGFVGRCRKLSWTPLELQTKIDTHDTQSQVEASFLELGSVLYSAYLNRVEKTGEDDFDGLLQRATEKINAGKTVFRRKSEGGDLNALRYICIDEYQDFSDLFSQLLTAIRKENPIVELFCVGDDWQAINGFAGSDLRFFQDFSKYIGESRKLYISTNYRSSIAIVNVGNVLMTGLGKPAISHKKSTGEVVISDLNEFEPSLIEKQRHPGDIITPVILRLVKNVLSKGFDVVLLNRSNYLSWYVGKFEAKNLDVFLESIRSYFPSDEKERISISTAHMYKGLEKSVVIVLDAVIRSYPLIHPDWVFSRILGDNPKKITDDERRLLYVALTRAKEKLFILTDGRSKSPFLEALNHGTQLSTIDWTKYPPYSGLTSSRLIINISNQFVGWSEVIGTRPIKDLLGACKYNWHSVRMCWEKSLPVNGFNIDMLKSEVWTSSANGINLKIFDEADALLAHYSVDGDCWNSIVGYTAPAELEELEVNTHQI
jgi:DNA helicase IV